LVIFSYRDQDLSVLCLKRIWKDTQFRSVNTVPLSAALQSGLDMDAAAIN
jgi:hypothetical protein